MCVRAKSLQSCLTLCNTTDCSPPGFSVHGILQARIPEWVAMPSSRGSSQPRNQTNLPLLCLTSLALADGFFTTSATWEAIMNGSVPIPDAGSSLAARASFYNFILVKQLATSFTRTPVLEGLAFPRRTRQGRKGNCRRTKEGLEK